jgi:photoactive yellow protein
VELLSYDGIDLAEVLPRIPRRGRDRMTFGIIELDYDGIVRAYNMGEAKISGRDPKDMIGRHFFTDIAPCTQTPEFYGRFKAGIRSGNLNARFDYVFNHQMDPTAVRVTMITSVVEGEQRVLVLVRVLTADERERSERDHERMRSARQQAAQPRPTPLPAKPRKELELPTFEPVAEFDSAPIVPPKRLPPPLTIAELEHIALGKSSVTLPDGWLARTEAAAALVDLLLSQGLPIYGLTSGFGPLAHEPAEASDEDHQAGLLRHLATGVGKPFSIEHTRAAMAARLHTLTFGHSAVSPRVIESLKSALDGGLTPVVPQLGSVV